MLLYEMLLYEMLIYEMLFSAMLTGGPCRSVSDCENLIRHMLIVDPAKRVDVHGIITHRWMEVTGDDPGFEHTVSEYNRPDPSLDLKPVNLQILQYLEDLGFDKDRTVKVLTPPSPPPPPAHHQRVQPTRPQPRPQAGQPADTAVPRGQ